MRVNHAGEIAAQGLYQGHAAVVRDPRLEQQMLKAARRNKPLQTVVLFKSCTNDELELLAPELGEFDLDMLGRALLPERDLRSLVYQAIDD